MELLESNSIGQAAPTGWHSPTDDQTRRPCRYGKDTTDERPPTSDVWTAGPSESTEVPEELPARHQHAGP